MSKPLDVNTLKPGQTVKITVAKAPRTEDDTQTVLRLMRLDPDIKRSLKKGHRTRMQNLVVRSRGGRPWEVREKSALIARAELGESWSLTYFPQIAPDLRKVAKFLSVA